MIKVNIEEGDILVNSAWVSFETPSLIIIELDTSSKYPQVGCYGEDQISLYADDHTLYKGDTNRQTNVEIDLPKDFCVQATRVGRYSVEIYCVNEAMMRKQEAKIIWETSRERFPKETEYDKKVSECHQYGLCVSEPELFEKQTFCTTCDICPRKK
jgi:hypothetical protein